jgi:hypothetical protein
MARTGTAQSRSFCLGHRDGPPIPNRSQGHHRTMAQTRCRKMIGAYARLYHRADEQNAFRWRSQRRRAGAGGVAALATAEVPAKSCRILAFWPSGLAAVEVTVRSLRRGAAQAKRSIDWTRGDCWPRFAHPTDRRNAAAVAGCSAFATPPAGAPSWEASSSPFLVDAGDNPWGH